MVTYASVFEAFGDGTRRRVFEALRQGPRTVSEVAAGMPVSRPAVSQHLRVLEAAGLVRVEPRGRFRFYEIDRDGLVALRTYVESFWEDVLGAYAARASERDEEHGADD